jgi:hypothetical protein
MRRFPPPWTVEQIPGGGGYKVKAAKRVYDHAVTKRQAGEVVRLSGGNGTIAEASN